jgi:hypothetical protein
MNFPRLLAIAAVIAGISVLDALRLRPLPEVEAFLARRKPTPVAPLDIARKEPKKPR